MGLSVKAEDDRKPGPIDWPATRAAIVAGLDVAAEYAALGVEFTRPEADGKGWRQCRAVGRDDRNPSAGVNLSSGLYHDFGEGGRTLSLFDFALEFGEFGRWIEVIKHYAARAGVELDPVPTHGRGRIREARYDYVDAAGEVRYAVFRYRLPNGKKEFSQHPPDGKGGWSCGAGCMDGVEPLPYRLPGLLASADAGDPVWICEGEKDCDRLAAEGLTATTNHQGSSSTDRTWPALVPHFAGRDCIVIPDNDPAGRLHAEKVCAFLKPVARSLRLLDLPGLPLKGDVSDWLDLGNTIDDLCKLAGVAPEWEPDAAPAEDPSRDATVADLRRLMSEDGWLWPLWIPSAALTLLASEAGTGKTRFCHDLHRRIALGLPWPDGRPMTVPPGGKVLWVPADNQHREMICIPPAFGIPDELVILNAPASDPFGGTSLMTVEELRDFEERIVRVRPVVVFIDTVTNTGDYKAQDASDAKRQYKPLQEIAIRTRVPIVCVTHLNAGGKVLGRRAVEKVRVVIQEEYPDPDGQPDRRKLWVSKSFDLKPPALGVTMGAGGNEYDDKPPAPPEAKQAGGRGQECSPKVDAAIAFLAARVNGAPRRVSELRREAEVEGIDSQSLYRAKDRLVLDEFETEGRKWWRVIPPDTPF